MFKRISQRLKDREEGFTLIELMVVFLIIAILIAIAIPTFLGARKRAQDRAAQSNLRNGLTAEKVYYTDFQKYATGATMQTGAGSDIEKSLTFLDATAPVNSRDVRVDVSTTANDSVCLSSLSASGTIFGLKDISSGNDAGTYYNKTGYTACTNAKLATDLNNW